LNADDFNSGVGGGKKSTEDLSPLILLKPYGKFSNIYFLLRAPLSNY
jgi:hypothetical protein